MGTRILVTPLLRTSNTFQVINNNKIPLLFISTNGKIEARFPISRNINITRHVQSVVSSINPKYVEDYK